MEKVLGQASVDIRANDKMFLRDLKKMLKEIKDQKINALLSIDTKEAQKELDRFKKSQQNDKINLKLNVSTAEARKDIDDFKKKMSGKGGTLKFDSKVTFAQARKDIAQFRKEQESRRPITLKARMTFAQARKDIKDFRENYPPVKLESTLGVSTDDAQQAITDFRTRQMSSDTMLNLTATVNFGLARTQLTAFKKEVDGRKLHYLVDANTNPARRSINRLIKDLNKEPIYVPIRAVNPDTGEIDSLMPPSMSRGSGINIPVNLEDDEAYEDMELLNKRVEEFREKGIDVVANVNTNKFDREVERLNAKIRAYDLGMEILAKPRLSSQDVTILRRQIGRTFPELGDEMSAILSDKVSRGIRRGITSGAGSSGLIPKELSKAMSGFMSAMTGVLPFDLVKDSILDVVGGLEGISTNAGLASTAIGGIAGALGAVSGAAVNVVTDIGQIAGVAGLLPAAFAANQIRVWTKQMAYSGMQTAIFSQNAKAVKEALKGMTPVMQHAAKYLREFFGEIGSAAQNGYWDQMGSEIQMTAEIIKGTLIKNFSRAGEVMALNHIEVLKQITAFEELGGLDFTFSNIIQSFENMREGMGAATRALLMLAQEGSKKLPELADLFTDLSMQFEGFVRANSENGNILKWIDVAYQRIGELGSVVGNTIEIITGIGKASEMAGSIGLTELANGFQRVSEYVNAPMFQGVMIDFFRDSQRAAEDLGEGLSHMWDGMIAAEPEFTQVMTNSAEVVMDVLKGVGDMLAADGEHSIMGGFVAISEGVRDAMADLDPAFQNIGEIMGMLGEMGAEVLRNLVPGINTASEMIKVFLEGFHEGFISLLPVLQNVASSFHHLLIEPIKIAGEALGGFMKFLSGLDSTVITAFMAIGMVTGPVLAIGKAFSFIRDSITNDVNGLRTGPLSSLQTYIGNSFNGLKNVDFSGVTQGINQIKKGAGELTSSTSKMGSTLASVGLSAVGAFDASRVAADKAAKAPGGLKTAWKGAGDMITGVGKTVAGASKGMVSALGAIGLSLPGLAISGAIALVTTAMADMQAGADEAKHSVEGFAKTFDEEINGFGEEAVAHFRKRFEELGQDWGTQLGFADDFKKTAEKVGISLDDLAKNFEGSKADVKAYSQSWVDVGNQIDNELNSNKWDFKTKFQATRDVMTSLSDDALIKMGTTRQAIEQMNDVELEKFVSSMRQAGKEGLEAINDLKDFRETLEGIKDVDLGSIWDSVNNGGAEMDGVRQALSVANEEVLRMQDNFEVLGSKTSSLNDKVSAFKDNLKLMGAETLTDTGGLSEYYASLDKVTGAFGKVKEAAKGGVDELMTFDSSSGKLVGTFKLQNQAARDLYDAVQLNTDSIHGIAMEAYNSAIKNGESVEVAISKAKNAASPMIEDMKEQLRGFGFEEGQIQAILDQAGLLEQDFEMGLDVKNIDEAKRKIIETQLAAQAFQSGDFTAYLKVMDEEAKSKLNDILQLGGDFSEVKINAQLDKLGFDMSYDELMQELALAKDPVAFVAQLQDDTKAGTQDIKNRIDDLKRDNNIPVSIANEAETEINTIRGSLDDMVRDPRNIELTTNARNAADEALAELRRLNEENPELNLDADISMFEEKINQAKNKVLSVEDRKVVIEAIDKATPAVGHWNEMVPNGKQAVLDILDKASPQVQGFNSMSMGDKEATIRAIDEANPSAMAWQSLTLEEKKAVLSVYDEASTAVQNYNMGSDLQDKYGNMLPKDDITAAVNSYNSLAFLDTKMGVLDVIDRATPAAGKWNQLPLDTKSAVMSAIDRATPVIEGYNAKNVDEKNAVIAAVDRATPAVNAWHQLPMEEKKAILSAQDNATPTVTAWNSTVAQTKNGIFNSIDNANPVLGTWNNTNASPKTAILNAVDAASGVQAAFNASPIKDKTAYLKANSAQAHAIQEAFDRLPIQDKNSMLTANNRPALSSQAEYDRLPIEDKLSLLTSDATKALSTQRAYEGIGMDNSNKEAKITADNSQAVDKVQDTDRMGIADKFFEIQAIIPQWVKSAVAKVGIHLAVGGILPGSANISAFANGGFSLPEMPNVSSFANGTERHVAQIAKGQTPYRVWAEPETGGEAYIPLAKSKRKRSMKILEQVAKYFGMNLLKYNNGGTYRGKSLGGGITSYADGGINLSEKIAEDKKAIRESFNELTLNLKSIFGATEKSPVAKSMESLEKALKDMANEYRKTSPNTSARANYTLWRLNNQRVLSNFWKSPGTNEAFTAHAMANNSKIRAANKSKQQFNPYYRLADYEKAISIISKQLEVQSNLLEKRIANRDSFGKSIADNLFSSFSLGDTVQSADNTGWRPPTTSADIARYTKDKLALFKKYSSKMKELVKSGYNGAIINEIASMKPEDAIYLADALLKDKSHMKAINSAYTEMFGSRGDKNLMSSGEEYVGGLAGNIGNYLAGSFYNSGININQGVVKGLTSDLSALERSARIMADAISKSFKETMGIKSPSRVMMKLGKFIPQGLAIGIDSGQSYVSASMSRMIRPSDMNLTARSSNPVDSARNSGIIGGANTSGATINVYPSQGLSEEQIGQAASRELLYRTLG